tara:strand:- start:1533 stop:1799 length:267 start_codon:yes stop_codon:yes gene_type:complete
MENCKKLLKIYTKLKYKYNSFIKQYNSFSHKGLCREDAMCNFDISKKIIITKNQNDLYYFTLTYNIKNYIEIIKRKNQYLKDAISRSY